MKNELGKIMIDVAKLVIGGVILAGLMRQDIAAVYLFSIGGAVAASLIFGGLLLIKMNNKEKI